MKELLSNIKQCNICLPHLSDGVNPVLSAHPKSKIAIIGQAPGSIVHKTGIPWDDKSGERLRDWLGVDKTTFYNKQIFAIIPMGFCYPGKGKTGDLPPRKECAPTWHPLLFEQLKHIEIIILIGSYAQNYYLNNAKKTLTATVKNYQEYLPKFIVLPHPSPRNNIWLKKNDWFEKDNLPFLKKHLKKII
ncbi:IclR family transcriptional regulator [Wenyingzhuangia fucanilytica]|uniref:IclR family transcriptional regulator n=1 Tax=Wenyingzhuangia fucanilytica TaxID=1790137 RepID=A0A1B1Y7L8_9FLAO|nr:uracil-DNA glycosylase family protein [Wenyingzhuangia fucanilytica]ANW96772.1 IclR family transcriptional regulator [Wenyingzhuangia fucanilytica]